MLAATVPIMVASLVLQAPVVAVASDGPYVAVAEGRSAHDCDRVSVWYAKHARAVRLGRATPCRAGSRIAGLAVARDRALWVERESASRWSVWTATPARRTPRLLARGPARFVLGPGNYDRRQGYGEGDVLPYAQGRHVVVLRANGSTSYTWNAPSDVVALGSDPALLVVAVADGRIFVLADGKVEQTLTGAGPARRVFWAGLEVVAEYASSFQVFGDDCPRTVRLASGDRVVAASGGRIVLARRGTIVVLPGCGATPVVTAPGTFASLDNDRLTFARGRRVTTEILF